MLPDVPRLARRDPFVDRLNAPTGAWCSLTCDPQQHHWRRHRLNAPTGAWCSLTPCACFCCPRPRRLNAPTGAWCSLTPAGGAHRAGTHQSQCTYRCVVLPDVSQWEQPGQAARLNAPTGAWCSLTARSRSTSRPCGSLNAPTGAWCSLTRCRQAPVFWLMSQCTYRCVVLPDRLRDDVRVADADVSMHLQVRGAP